MKNFPVEKIYEQRRQDLKRLIEKMGRGSIASVAKTIDVEPNYISRALYPPGKDGKKNIGDELVIKLDRHYPEWRRRPLQKAEHCVEQERAAYLVDELIKIVETLSNDDQQKLIGLATYLKNSHEDTC